MAHGCDEEYRRTRSQANSEKSEATGFDGCTKECRGGALAKMSMSAVCDLAGAAVADRNRVWRPLWSRSAISSGPSQNCLDNASATSTVKNDLCRMRTASRSAASTSESLGQASSRPRLLLGLARFYAADGVAYAPPSHRIWDAVT